MFEGVAAAVDHGMHRDEPGTDPDGPGMNQDSPERELRRSGP
jgi:hypothetical protein